MTDVTSFQDRFPEFCQVDDKRVQLFLDDTALLMGSEVRWLNFYDVAHAYHTAHLLVVAEATESGDSAVLAPISMQEVSDVTIKNAVKAVDSTAEDLYSTSYGKRYISYRRIAFAGIYGV